jgi:hypothetical protein
MEFVMEKQRLHLVFGGKVTDARGTEFVDTEQVEIIGVYPNYAQALEAWRGAAQTTVDDAQTRYFVAHLHRLFEPQEDAAPPAPELANA